jgi:type I restriction enzyme S subunit
VPAYLDFLLRTKPYVAEYQARSTGIRASRLRLYPDRFLDISFVRPPLEEQEQMVRFLGAKDLMVARYIRSKRELIKRLEEEADEHIAEAVTSGVDGSRPRRRVDAGWLEEIPADWKVGPLKRLARSGRKTFTDGDWIESPYITDSGIRLIQTGNVGVGRYREQGFRYISEATFDELHCTEVLPNDMLICRLGEPVGRACLAPDLGCRMITSVDVCILRPHDGIYAPYAARAMSARPYLDWVNSLVRGSTRDRVSRSMLGSFPFVAPPFDEQLRICAALDERLNPIENAIACARDEITLVLECRDRLVGDVVTGRLDVRTVTVATTAEEADEDLNDLLSTEELLGSRDGADGEVSDADD